MLKIIFIICLCFYNIFSAQKIENYQNIKPFLERLKTNKQVFNILLIGDSHIQGGYISEVLRNYFQNNYGNAGRGLVFPYPLANSNGNLDFEAYTNMAWHTFRTSYEQDIYKEIGAMGFVMGNNENSIIQIDFKNTDDSFDKVKIFGQPTHSQYNILQSSKSLKDYIKPRKSLQKYIVKEGENYFELASKFNIVTTRLLQLNGISVKNPKAGQIINVENVDYLYDNNFKNYTQILSCGELKSINEINYPSLQKSFLMEIIGENNILYGFQFLKSGAKKGVIFNSVGVNGATYADFIKYPLQIKQLKATEPHFIIIALGTNESLNNTSETEFKANARTLIKKLRENNDNLPILLISPTDNNINPNKIAKISNWIQEISKENNTAFLNLYKFLGGKGYFQKKLTEKKANKDNVHFLPTGYQEQASIILKCLFSEEN